MENICIVNELRKKLLAMLKVEDFKTDINLTQIGLNSIMIMKISAFLKRRGIDISFGELIEQPTFDNWVNIIKNLNNLEKESAIPRNVIKNRFDKEEFELTDVQYAYWAGRQDDQELGGVGCHAYFEFEGEIADGIPLSNQKMFVLDSNFKQCPNEVKGEIYIGGLGLASGYYGDKELTEEKFLYNEELEERLFRTGDIGYYTKNGILMICGRKDNQIKINGNRVEIGEIESVIKETKEVTDCTVVYHKEANKASGLFAFLEPRKSVECTAGHLEEAEVNKLKRICTQRFENINREDFMKWKKQSDKAALADMFALFSNLGLFNERDKEYSRSIMMP